VKFNKPLIDLGDQESLYVYRLLESAVVKIYTIKGILIISLSQKNFGDQGWVVWDGKDKEGKEVKVGVYQVVILDDKNRHLIRNLAVIK